MEHFIFHPVLNVLHLQDIHIHTLKGIEHLSTHHYTLSKTLKGILPRCPRSQLLSFPFGNNYSVGCNILAVQFGSIGTEVQGP